MDIRLLFITFYFPIEICFWRTQTTLGSTEKTCMNNHYIENGSCIECPAGFYGINCNERCPIRYYGRLCLQECTGCTWHDCDSVTGCNDDVETVGRTQRDNTTSDATPKEHTTLWSKSSSYPPKDDQVVPSGSDIFETGPTSRITSIYGFSNSNWEHKKECDFYMKMGLIGSATFIFFLIICLGVMIRLRLYEKRRFDESMRKRMDTYM